MQQDLDPGLREAVLSALRGSGFPFQTAVTALVRECPGWTVTATEYPWQDATGADQFLDLVAEDVSRDMVVTVECKKTSKETLTFLSPTGGRPKRDTLVRCLCSRTTNEYRRDTTGLFCADVRLSQPSKEAAFCVVSTSPSSKDQRLLERDARQLVRATDAFAIRRSQAGRGIVKKVADHIFLPLLVTNARLLIATYAPTDVSLQTGQFVEDPADLVPVPWVRFTKVFTFTPLADLGDRTVIVTTADGLKELLARLDAGHIAIVEESAAYLPVPV